MNFKIGDLVMLDSKVCASNYAWPMHTPAIVTKVKTNDWGWYIEVMTPTGPREWLQRETKVLNRNENR